MRNFFKTDPNIRFLHLLIFTYQIFINLVANIYDLALFLNVIAYVCTLVCLIEIATKYTLKIVLSIYLTKKKNIYIYIRGAPV